MSVPRYDEVLIGGRWVPAANGTAEVVNPATEETAALAPECSPAQVEEAARAARQAFEHGEWPRLSGADRAARLREAAELFRKQVPRITDLVIDETGALASVVQQLHMGIAAARLESNAQLAEAAFEETLPPLEIDLGAAGRGRAEGVVVRDPVGVVGCISPFNVPLANCAGKLGPALACGNTVVVKPPPQAPNGVLELCRTVASVMPPGVVNVVSGSGPDIGEALTASPDVDMISFTGSSAVGRVIHERCGAQMKRTLLELGGKSACIVFSDCDIDQALSGAMRPWTFHSGQICTAPTRLLIEEPFYEEFTAKLAAAGLGLPIGRPRDAGAVVGPLISAVQRERVESYIARGNAEGATLACGGGRPPALEHGYFVEPTLFTDATNDMTIAREEIFGPVITAIPFRDADDAVALANDSDYGLAGYVWSGDRERARDVASRMRTGAVQINGSPPRQDTPFGGFKHSGVGRDGGLYAIHAYTELKHIGWPA